MSVGSVEFFGCLSDGSGDQLGIDCFDLRDLLDDLRDCVLPRQITVDRVSGEEHGLDVLERLQLGKLIPRLNLVLSHKEGVELNTRL